MSRKPLLFIATPLAVLLVLFVGLYITVEMSEPWAKKKSKMRSTVRVRAANFRSVIFNFRYSRSAELNLKI